MRTVRQPHLWLCAALPDQAVVCVLHMMQGTTTRVKSIHWRQRKKTERERHVNHLVSADEL